MIQVYYEQPGYAQVVAYFANEEVYGACVETLEKHALECNFEFITESVKNMDFEKLYDFTNEDEKPKSTYFIFGTQWVTEYENNGIEGIIESYFDEADNYFSEGASFEFIDGETSCIEFAEAMDGWNKYTTISETEFNQLKK
jgi:hypothetical protein